MWTPASPRMSPVAEPFYFRDQAERCRRLARDSTDPPSRDNLLGLAEEYIARAAAQETGDPAVWQTGPNEDGAA
jgi:hypothetical protein